MMPCLLCISLVDLFKPGPQIRRANATPDLLPYVPSSGVRYKMQRTLIGRRYNVVAIPVRERSALVRLLAVPGPCSACTHKLFVIIHDLWNSGDGQCANCANTMHSSMSTTLTVLILSRNTIPCAGRTATTILARFEQRSTNESLTRICKPESSHLGPIAKRHPCIVRGLELMPDMALLKHERAHLPEVFLSNAALPTSRRAFAGLPGGVTVVSRYPSLVF